MTSAEDAPIVKWTVMAIAIGASVGAAIAAVISHLLDRK